MSHVATVDVEIQNLDWLAKACQLIGLEFVPDQKKYKWYGRHVGDYPLPAGFKKEDLGKCEHALRLPYVGSRPRGKKPYEIGVCKRRDGRPGWSLLWDFFAGGHGLRDVVGQDCCELVKAYTTVATREIAARQGMRVSQQQLPDGSIRLVLSK